jgi:hypothetical protein
MWYVYVFASILLNGSGNDDSLPCSEKHPRGSYSQNTITKVNRKREKIQLLPHDATMQGVCSKSDPYVM